MRIQKNIKCLLSTGFGALLVSCGSSTSTGSGTGSGSSNPKFVAATGNWLIEAAGSIGEASNLLIGDFFRVDGDEAPFPDLLILGTGGTRLYTNQLGANSNSWEDRGIIAGTANTNITGGSVVADADTDDDGNEVRPNADFVAFLGTGGTLRRYESDGTGGFALRSSQPAIPADSVWVASSTDYLATAANSGGHRTLENDRALNATTPSNAAASIPDATQVIAGDWDGDGRGDFLFIPEDSSVDPVIAQKDGSSTTFTSRTSVFTRPTPLADIQFAATADLDVDGDLDILFATDNGFELYTNDSEAGTGNNPGSISFELSGSANFDTDPDNVLWMVVEDFTEDQVPDILVTRDGALPVFYSGQGNLRWTDTTGTFGASQLSAVFGDGTTITKAFATDIDQDNVLDILFMSNAGDITPFFNSEEDGQDSE